MLRRREIFNIHQNGFNFILKDQELGIKLNCYQPDEDCIQDFTATDDQNDKFDVNFEIDPETDKDQIFQMRKSARSKATLLLKSDKYDIAKEYQVN